jgi:hypothetical protein
MSDRGWLQISDTGLVFVRFEVHNTESGKQRALAAIRAANHRKKSNDEVTEQPLRKAHLPAPLPAHKKTSRGSKGAGALSELSETDLSNASAMLAWVDAQQEKRKPIVGGSDDDRLNVLAAAERAVEEGEDPIGLFGFIVGQRKWGFITHPQEERARKKLADLRRSTGPPAGKAVELRELAAQSLKGIDP